MNANRIKLLERFADLAAELHMVGEELIDDYEETFGYIKAEDAGSFLDTVMDAGYGASMEAEAVKEEIERLKRKIRKLEGFKY